MSKCSKKCNEIKARIDSISGLDDDWVYGNLLALESQVEVIVNTINKYADKNEVNGTCFNKKMSKEEIAECIEKAKTILNQKPGLIFTPLEIHAIEVFNMYTGMLNRGHSATITVRAVEEIIESNHIILSMIRRMSNRLDKLQEVDSQICNEELITKEKYQDILKENANKDKVIDLMAKKIKEEDPFCGVFETPIEKIIQRYYEKAGDAE